MNASMGASKAMTGSGNNNTNGSGSHQQQQVAATSDVVTATDAMVAVTA